ncbi:hypothetical protein [Streptomyces sp. NPDC088725]|uniref:hypothetical protein n=1 Tax=Streptomyces sp. NPDC088725 TaxID=3365873 RepID=UPI0038239F6E
MKPQRHQHPRPQTQQPQSPALTVGMVVYDRAYDMIGVVDAITGPVVSLSRPTGLTWQSRWFSVRRGTEYEQRQLRAIANLHILRQKGL